jgi:hypothetical protein
MLNTTLYNQAFNLAFQNYEAAHVQHHEAHEARAQAAMTALLDYAARHGYALVFDGSQFLFHPCHLIDRWRDAQ